MYFNPRSPQGGATSFGFIISLTVSNFNPRSPQGGATPLVTIPCNALDISIHAPRKGERLTVLCFVISTTNFNPRSPQGGATKLICLQQHLWRISIHAPRKGERRREADRALAYIKISIHAPRKGERRSCLILYVKSIRYFNPRSPQGGATLIVPSGNG